MTNKMTATYVDGCGSDLSVVNAARVSFGKKSDWVYSGVDTNGPIEKLMTQGDKKLIKYLAKHKHMSPFGHAFASFHCTGPLFVHAQLVKHKFLRTNTISRRYTTENIEFYWRGRSADKKQGSDGVVGTDNLVGSAKHNDICKSFYQDLIDSGVAPEMARMVLPQSTMTEWYWSGSLDAFADMCRLRLPSDTQQETRVVAQQISEVLGTLFPVSWSALMSNS
jgi:thymidylate synthase (FAD)